MEFKVVIPARFGASRLPGKPLRELAGWPLVRHVHARASESGAEVVIATDDARIRDACEGFGAVVCMTAADHESGTARIAEVVAQRGWDDAAIVVNLQGDEPLVPPSLLRDVAMDLANHPEADMATLATPLDSGADLADPNVVKVVTGRDGGALYFSRSEIPFARNPAAVKAASHGRYAWKRHVGLYAYRAGALRAFTAMAPSPLEVTERLEQLRFLETGHRIVMAEACEFIPAGVDTPEDLERARKLIEAGI